MDTGSTTGTRAIGALCKATLALLALGALLLGDAPLAAAKGGPPRAESSKMAQERAAKRKRGKPTKRVSRRRRGGARTRRQASKAPKAKTRPKAHEGGADTVTFSPEKGKAPIFASVKPRPTKKKRRKKTTRMKVRRRKAAARKVTFRDPIERTHGTYQPGGSKPYADGTRETRMRSGTSDGRILGEGSRTLSAAEAERQLRRKAKGKDKLPPPRN